MEEIRKISMGNEMVGAMGMGGVATVERAAQASIRDVERACIVYPVPGSYLELRSGRVLKCVDIEWTKRGGEYLRLAYDFVVVIPGSKGLRFGTRFRLTVEEWMKQVNSGKVEQGCVAINHRGEVERRRR